MGQIIYILKKNKKMFTRNAAFLIRRSPSPGPVAGRTRSRSTPPPPTLRLSREAFPDRRTQIPTFYRAPGASRPSLLRSPFIQRPARQPPAYENFERARSTRPNTRHPVPEPRLCKSEPEPTLTTSTTACQTDTLTLPVAAIKQAVAKAVGVALQPVMRANCDRFDGILTELTKIKSDLEDLRSCRIGRVLFTRSYAQDRDV